jgi:outer membrane protein
MSKRLFAIILIIFTATAAAYAQGAAVKNSAQGNNGGAGKVAPLTSGKIAVIDSRAFGDGIGEMKKQLDKLEGEFQPRYQELESLQNQLVKFDQELKQITDPAAAAQKTEQAQRVKKEFERKREDFQTDYQKRQESVLGPLRDKVLKFLETYASQHEIIMVFDLAPAAQGGLVFLNPGTNITEDFIKEYNKQNPVPGAPPLPAPQIK